MSGRYQSSYVTVKVHKYASTAPHRPDPVYRPDPVQTRRVDQQVPTLSMKHQVKSDIARVGQLNQTLLRLAGSTGCAGTCLCLFTPLPGAASVAWSAATQEGHARRRGPRDPLPTRWSEEGFAA